MSDFKTVEQLCYENPNLNSHILSLADDMAALEKKNKELEHTLSELKKYYQEFDKFTATVYDPNKSTYKELEDKLQNFEIEKNREIDELLTTQIKPLREKVEQYEKSLDLVQSMSINDSITIKELRETIKNQQTIINYAAGYISACEQFRDKHPLDVKKWLFGELDNEIQNL
jgi:septal ring factor EnvC (AmiA/AmiB activator)